MTDRLYIHIPIDDTQGYSCLADEATVLNYDSASDLQQAVADKSVYLLLPSQHINLCTVNLPAMSAQKRQQALPYALEEQLIDDIDELHFVLGPAQGQQYPVAIINKKVLANIVQIFLDAGANCVQAIPDVMVIPLAQNSWHLVYNHDFVWLRCEQNYGFCTHLANAQMALQSLLIQKQAPAQLMVTPLVPGLNMDLSELPLLQTEIINNEHSADLLQWYAQSNEKQLPFNMLTAEFKQKHKSSKQTKLWRLAGVSVCLWLVVFFITSSIDYIHLNKEVKQTKQQVAQIYKKVFPQAKTVTAPKARIQQALNTLNKQYSGGPFLGLLTQAGDVWRRFGNINIDELRYQNNQLTINVSTDNFSELDSLTQALQAEGLSVQQTNATSKADNTITARLMISGG